jgi:hypothetical protein
MIDYANALRRVVARAKPLPAESVPLTVRSEEPWLRHPSRAPIRLSPRPRWTFAVKAADTRRGEAARQIKVVEDLPRADQPQNTELGQAIRI